MSLTDTATAAPSSKTGAAGRIWELDFLRGLAIVLMVFYHLGFDLIEFCGLKSILGIRLDLDTPLMSAAQTFFAGLFIVLCGISSTLSRGNLKRALKILAVALLVTIATYIFAPSEAIWFGILQCLGACILIYAWLFRKAGPRLTAAAGAAVIAAGVVLPAVLRHVRVDFNWLMPFGVTSGSFSTYDYFPLLPWLGVFLLGAFLGKTVYARRKSLLPFRPPAAFFSLAGRHSLLIYIAHQPLIMGVLYVTGLMH